MTIELALFLIAIPIAIYLYWLRQSISSTEEEEPTLRPTGLDGFVGQEPAKETVRVMTSKGRLSDHLLMVGPAGTGKTTLARIAAGTANLHSTIGSHLRSPTDAERALVAGSDMLFIDEVHAASRKALEVLYTALEDGIVYRRVGEPITLRKDWRFIASTTDSGKLPAPFRDRFGHTIYLDYYDQEDLVDMLQRSMEVLGVKLKKTQLQAIARRARGTPRVANTLLRRAADYASEEGQVPSLAPLWIMLGIDSDGLNPLDRRVIRLLRSSEKPMGLDQLALRAGVDKSTISEAIEPYLLRRGLIDIKHGGRVAR